MVLAGKGILTTEDELRRKAPLQPGGLAIEDLEGLAHTYGLRGSARRLSLDEIGALIQSNIFPIVYVLLRLDGGWTAHSVLPVDVSSETVLILDLFLPPPGERRLQRIEFLEAQHWLGNWALVLE